MRDSLAICEPVAVKVVSTFLAVMNETGIIICMKVFTQMGIFISLGWDCGSYCITL